jgi:hypothetical protein
MTKHTNPTPASDEQVRTLLERYNCPVPFHEVRTRFLGNIATPVMSASPIKMVEKLWGGELPAFDSIDVANELIGALVMGLWNRLTRHQDRNSPFRLMRIDSAPTREGLAALALMWRTRCLNRLWCKLSGSMQRNAREHYAAYAARTAFQISGAVLPLMRSFPSLN